MSRFRISMSLRLLFAVVMVVLSAALPLPVQAGVAAGSIPTFSIVTVVPNQTVTIQTANFPPNQTFTVRMGDYGTYGIGGYVVGSLSSGAGGTLQATFSIPAALKDKAMIAIRADGNLGYYAYNWFYNTAPGGTVTPPVNTGYSGYPTFNILSVVRDDKVTVKAYNLPPNQTFTVRMGAYGSYGKGGPVVGTFDSGSGGNQEQTYAIPDGLKGSYQIAMRMDSPLGYYAFNWFYNQTTDGTTPVVPPPSGYQGYPTFSILAVTRDATVTIQTKNLPPNQTFTVRMGAYGTYGMGGTVVATFDSAAGGAQQQTYTIPDGLKGSAQIAIRMDSNLGYYAYNWFYNQTTP
ncbi:MAG: hypothetical protein LDL12_03535 [Anaerolinea sp.]|nr:hypothetical protein [Anaerolinea sp.]